MTRIQQWTKHRGIAKGIAAGFWIPGLLAEDVRQEADCALWEATGAYDRERGSFPAFARTVIKRHLTDMLRAATARGKRPTDVALEDRHEDRSVRDRMEHRLELLDIARTLPTLTDLEREALGRIASGVPYRGDKRLDNAAQRARQKLRNAA